MSHWQQAVSTVKHVQPKRAIVIEDDNDDYQKMWDQLGGDHVEPPAPAPVDLNQPPEIDASAVTQEEIWIVTRNIAGMVLNMRHKEDQPAAPVAAPPPAPAAAPPPAQQKQPRRVVAQPVANIQRDPAFAAPKVTTFEGDPLANVQLPSDAKLKQPFTETQRIPEAGRKKTKQEVIQEVWAGDLINDSYGYTYADLMRMKVPHLRHIIERYEGNPGDEQDRDKLIEMLRKTTEAFEEKYTALYPDLKDEGLTEEQHADYLKTLQRGNKVSDAKPPISAEEQTKLEVKRQKEREARKKRMDAMTPEQRAAYNEKKRKQRADKKNKSPT